MTDQPDHKPDTYNLQIAADRRAAKAELRDAREAVMMNYIIASEINREAVTRETIPEEWLTLDEIYPPEGKKVRVTLLLDEEIAKYFRARGRGYQAFINEVLKFFVKLRMSKIIEGYGDRGPEGEVL